MRGGNVVVGAKCLKSSRNFFEFLDIAANLSVLPCALVVFRLSVAL